MDMSAWFLDTVTIAAASGISSDGTGEMTYSAQTTLLARVESHTKTVRTSSGAIAESDHKFTTTTPVGLLDRVWLPGDDTAQVSAARKPVTINKAYTKDGSYTLYEVWL